MSTPLIEGVLDALHEASDLDVIRQLYSNEIGDQQAPWLGAWVVELCNAEQSRRDAEEDGETDFRIVDTAGVPLDQLILTANFALGVYHTAENIRTQSGQALPTVALFAWALHNVLFAELVLRAKAAQAQGANIG